LPIDADALADRRHLKRRLTLWRYAAVGALGVALFALSFQSKSPFHSAQIARVEISGIITDDRALQELIEELRDDKAIKAVILAIDSPGGTTTGAEALYTSVRDLAVEKPLSPCSARSPRPAAISRRSPPIMWSRAAIRSRVPSACFFNGHSFRA